MNNEPLPGYDYWEEHHEFTAEQWIHEVYNEFTRQGYWDWVRDEINSKQSEN